MSDGLSQAEIDALMNGGSAAAEDDSKEEKVEEKTEVQSDRRSRQHFDVAGGNDAFFDS